MLQPATLSAEQFIPIPEETKRLHENLSRSARRFLELVENDPRLLRDPCLSQPNWGRPIRYSYPVQFWPTLLNARKLAIFQRATVGLLSVVKRIPELIFDNDPRRISDYYGFGNEWVTAALLAEPNGVEEAIARGDYVDGPSGFKCIEFNLSSKLGGWQLRYSQDAFMEHPLLGPFLRESRAVYRDTFDSLYMHLAEQALRRNLCADGRFGFAIVRSKHMTDLEELPPHLAAAAVKRYTNLMRELYDLDARLIICTDHEVEERANHLYHRGTRIDAVLLHTDLEFPPAIFRSFKAGTITLYNSPLAAALGDKRNLALLSELAGTGRLRPEEEEIVRSHLPWTREVTRRETVFEGRSVRIPEVLLAEQDRFVLKEGNRYAGEGVFVGRFVPADAWRRTVDDAVASGTWVVQEWVDSHPYCYRSGDVGCTAHDVIWGLFAFGPRYGGGFLRMTPRGTLEGVVNAARGATEGLLFEVDGDG